MNYVSLKVAEFLKQFGYNEQSLYVYDLGVLKFSMEPDLICPIPAPTLQETVDYLWKLGIHIFYSPVIGGGCKGIIQVDKNEIKLNCIYKTPKETLENCLDYMVHLYEK